MFSAAPPSRPAETLAEKGSREMSRDLSNIYYKEFGSRDGRGHCCPDCLGLLDFGGRGSASASCQSGLVDGFILQGRQKIPSEILIINEHVS